LVGDTTQSAVAGANNSVNLVAQVSANTSVTYTDGTDSAGTTVSGIGLPASIITPLQVFNVQFQQNS
jgi:hypothetical protein